MGGDRWLGSIFPTRARDHGQRRGLTRPAARVQIHSSRDPPFGRRVRRLDPPLEPSRPESPRNGEGCGAPRLTSAPDGRPFLRWPGGHRHAGAPDRTGVLHRPPDGLRSTHFSPPPAPSASPASSSSIPPPAFTPLGQAWIAALHPGGGLGILTFTTAFAVAAGKQKPPRRGSRAAASRGAPHLEDRHPSLPDGSVIRVTLPSRASEPSGLCAGPGGGIWEPERGRARRLPLHLAPSATPASPPSPVLWSATSGLRARCGSSCCW